MRRTTRPSPIHATEMMNSFLSNTPDNKVKLHIMHTYSSNMKQESFDARWTKQRPMRLLNWNHNSTVPTNRLFRSTSATHATHPSKYAQLKNRRCFTCYILPSSRQGSTRAKTASHFFAGHPDEYLYKQGRRRGHSVNSSTRLRSWLACCL